MQVDHIKTILEPPATKRLKLKHDELLSSFAFKSNLRRYIMVVAIGWTDKQLPLTYKFVFLTQAGAYTRSFLSLT